jgi:hypothetical protein
MRILSVLCKISTVLKNSQRHQSHEITDEFALLAAGRLRTILGIKPFSTSVTKVSRIVSIIAWMVQTHRLFCIHNNHHIVNSASFHRVLRIFSEDLSVLVPSISSSSFFQFYFIYFISRIYFFIYYSNTYRDDDIIKFTKSWTILLKYLWSARKIRDSDWIKEQSQFSVTMHDKIFNYIAHAVHYLLDR